jgi:hypothetical protein
MATFTIRIGGAEYAGKGESRLEAFAEAVDRAAPALREALTRSRARRTSRPRGQRAVRPGTRPSLERGAR